MLLSDLGSVRSATIGNRQRGTNMKYRKDQITEEMMKNSNNRSITRNRRVMRRETMYLPHWKAECSMQRQRRLIAILEETCQIGRILRRHYSDTMLGRLEMLRGRFERDFGQGAIVG
jgi:hypothetical protein